MTYSRLNGFGRQMPDLVIHLDKYLDKDVVYEININGNYEKRLFNINEVLDAFDYIKKRENNRCDNQLLGEACEVWILIFVRLIMDWETRQITNADEQQHKGDFIVNINNEEVAIDVKSGTVDRVPYANLSCSHWKYNTPYYGKPRINDTHYSCLYYLDMCDILAVVIWENKLPEIYFVDCFQNIRVNLWNNFVDEEGIPIEANIKDFNNKYRHGLASKIVYDNKLTYCISFALDKDVIKELGGVLKIVHFK